MYQGGLDRSGMACLGRVISVDPVSRRLRVKTMGAPEKTDDLDLIGVRILHGQFHGEGDEEVNIPRVGTYGVVIFVMSEPVWIGAFPLDSSNGISGRANQEKLQPGDYIVHTNGGNKVIVRVGGAIQVISTTQCRTYWLPSQNLINSVCLNYELETAGGHMHWKLDESTDNTTLSFKVWDNVTAANIATLEVGSVPSDDSLILDFAVGPVSDTELTQKQRNMQIKIAYDGSTTLDFGPGNATFTVDATTGNVTFQTKGTIKGTVDKDVVLDVKGSVNAKITKDVTMAVGGSATVNVKKGASVSTDGKASVAAKGGVSISTDGDATVSAKGAANVSAGGDATVSAKGQATIKGTGGTNAGSSASPTTVDGQIVSLGGAGGVPVARLGDMVAGIGNLGSPVISTICQGSPKVSSS